MPELVGKKHLLELDKDKLIELIHEFGRRWLAHDGFWFQAAEKRWGIHEAIALDIAAWEKFSAYEAARIMRFLNLKPGGGIPALKKALNMRLYAFVNEQEILDVEEDGRIIFRMNTCRVQEARKRKGLTDFPCKEVGLVEYKIFAKTIDPRIEVHCLACPPDEHPGNYYCAWEFRIGSV